MPSRPDRSGQPRREVVLKIMKKEELRNVDGSDSLHPNRSGDVVVVLKPPYQFDAATLGRRSPSRSSSGSTATCPRPSIWPDNVNMHATFVAAGPGIRQGRACDGRAGH